MKWKELRNFLNAKLDDNQYITLTTNIGFGKVVIIKDNAPLNLEHSFIIMDNSLEFNQHIAISESDRTALPNYVSVEPPSEIEYYEYEVSTYFK